MPSNGDPSAYHWSHPDEFGRAPRKASPVATDRIAIEDSEDGFKPGYAEIGDLPFSSAIQIEDDGTPVADAEVINFGTGLSVTDNGSGEVTVDAGNLSYAETVGDGSETTFPIEHGLGTANIVVSVVELSTGEGLVHGVDFTWEVVDQDEIEVTFSSPPDTDDATLVVLAAGGPPSGGSGGGVWSPWLDVKDSTDTPDDTFAGSSLDGKWTVAAGSPGTVDLTSATNQGIYDLSTRPALLVQTRGNGNHVRFYQSYELPDGKSIIVKFTPGSWGTSSTNNVAWTGIGLNSSTTSPDTGTHVRLLMDPQSTGVVRILAYDGSIVLGESDTFAHPTTPLYFRIHRSGTSYLCFVSTRGDAWIYMGAKTISPAATTIWLYQDSLANAPTGAPGYISYFDWIRQGSAGIDPW